MNSEELELSLRTEFENYLKNAIAEMKQEVSEFQQSLDSAFEKHKSQIDESVKGFTEKLQDEKELEESFRDSVSEHLKLAREEGSKVTAEAFAEAEKLRDEEIGDSSDSAASVQFADIRDAITEISSKDSQSEILKSLVHHATQFTPRGAFFIVKNEHLVGWRMFGTEEHFNPQVVREVFFPVDSKTALSESVTTLATVQGSNDANEDNLLYLNKLDFNQSENMCAIPLVARGRGVAVLYADNGTGGETVNVEVLETLMRVAGLTVEVLASTQIAKTQVSEQAASVISQEQQFSEEVSVPSFDDVEQPEVAKINRTDFSVDDSPLGEVQAQHSPAPKEEISSGFEFQPVEVSDRVAEESAETVSFEDNSWDKPIEEVSTAQELEDDYSVTFDSDLGDSVSTEENYSAEVNQPFEETPRVDAPQFGSFEPSTTEAEISESAYEFETTSDQSFDNVADASDAPTEELSQGFGSEATEIVEEKVEAVEQKTSTSSVRTRFGDRNVDLPIEVTEDERRLHNDARRFARLLVSEIKLYNEQKVKEGRESSDLYERLREAIDRSREMYDKRVQPPVAAKFDYFNYELVNTLAEGEETKLGGSYPGATV